MPRLDSIHPDVKYPWRLLGHYLFMQILIFGMHRSGTSIVARLLNMMGAYFAPEGVSTGANRENPKGFWERRDVRNLNDKILHSVGADWDRLGNFSLDQVPAQAMARFDDEARKIILELDAHRPWFLKEPRLCLLAPLWLHLLEVPISILVYRSAMEVARSLETRNGFPIPFGAALWECYNRAALNATLGGCRFQVNHAELLADPVRVVHELYAKLEAVGVRGLRLPSQEEILAFVDPALYRAKNPDPSSKQLTASQRKLQKAFESGTALLKDSVLSLSLSARKTLIEGVGWSGAQLKIAELEQLNNARLKEVSRLREKLEQSEQTLARVRREEEERRLAWNEKVIAWDEQRKAWDEQRKAWDDQRKAWSDRREAWSKKQRANESLVIRREGQITELREALADYRTRLEQGLLQLSDLQRSHDAKDERFRNLVASHHERAEEIAVLTARSDEQEVEIANLRQAAEKHSLDLQTSEQRHRRVSAELDAARKSNRILQKSFARIEKSFSRLRGSRSFHFMAYTMRRLGLVSRTPRKCVETIKTQLAETHKALSKVEKNKPAIPTRQEDTPPILAREAARPQAAGSAPTATPLEPALPASPTADVVVCVHNAPDDVYRCLSSIVAHPTALLRKLILVDDGSEEKTTSYLHDFARQAAVPTVLLTSQQATGYTQAANRGISAADANYVILLNSDTVVTAGWIERLIACGESDPLIGIVGPLSNAASWQSVPERFAEDGDWAVNPMDLSSLDRIIRAFSLRHDPAYPRVPILNGFCFAIKREVINSVGLFDAVAFPSGYGEENDYSFRAAEAGYALAVADDCYIYHAKSRSYSHARRFELAEQSGTVLRQKYGPRVKKAVAALRSSAGLERARTAFSWALDAPPISTLFLMHFRGFGGGISSIVQEAAGLRDLGAAVQVAIRAEDREFYFERFPSVPRRLFFVFNSQEELISYAGSFEMVVATLFTGVRILRDLLQRFPQIVPCYYIQDYEPRFFPTTDPHYQEAEASYTLIPGINAYAKTRWLCEIIAEKHGISVHKVEPSIDRAIFSPGPPVTSQLPRIICAMIRPHTAYRSPQLTFDLLRQLKLEYGDQVEVQIFGVESDNPFLARQAPDFTYRVLGILPREAVAELLRSAFLFIDASTYQAFGRTGLEAMACGCATILPKTGGCSEYAVDGMNTLLADSENAEDILRKARRCLEDPALHGALVREGLITASRYDIINSCVSELRFFESLRFSPPQTVAQLRAEEEQITTVPLSPSPYKFRITILSSTTNIHGGTKRLLTLAQRLHLRGHRVTFIRHFPGRELDWFKLDAPLLDLHFDQHSSLQDLETLLPDADILLTYGNNRAAPLLDGLSRRKGLKYLLFMHLGVHDLAVDLRNASLPHFQKLTTTRWIAEKLLELGTEATPIGFGVHDDQFYPVESNRDFRVGTLLHKDEWKRSQDAFEAFKLVRERIPSARLVAFGQIKDPPLEVECEYYYDPDQEKLRQIYSSCAAWITPSLWEGLGMCSVEAMLCGTPLVTTDTGGGRDFCQGRNSILVDKNAPQSIAQAVTRLLARPEHAQALARQALKDIKKQTWDRCLDRLEATFLAEAQKENPTVIAQRRCELTIGIPIFNQPDYLRACLESIYEHTTSDFELILLDDASGPETQALVRATYEARPESVRYIRHEERKGFPYNCNRIISNSCGRYICFLNSDTIVTPQWDQLLISALETETDLGLAGPSTSYGLAKNYNQSAQQLEEVYRRRFEMNPTEIADFAARLQARENGSVEETQYLNGFCLMVKSELFSKIGFFDEEFGLGSREEVEFIDRARLAGYRCAWVKSAYVHHYGHRSFAPDGEASQALWQRNKDRYFQIKNQRKQVLLGDQKIAFLYNGKYASSTRKRTFEIVRQLQPYIDVRSFHLPSVTTHVYRACDIFVLQRIGGLNEKISALLLTQTLDAIAEGRSLGKVFLYDIDDLVFDAQEGAPRRLMEACQGVITSTPRLQELAREINPRVLCLKNGLDYERFLAAPPACLDPERFHVLCASLGAVGQTTLRDIAQRVRTSHPDVEVHLFCDVNFIEDQTGVTLHPSVVLDELFGFIKSADVVLNFDWPDDAYRKQLQEQYGIMPSQLRDFVDSKSGLKYYNAGAAAKPIISTRQPSCYTKMIEHGVNGFLADTVDEFVATIIKLREEPALRKAVGRQAFEDVLAQYTLDQTLFDYLDAFFRVIPGWKFPTREIVESLTA